jgi:hypothetical protein
MKCWKVAILAGALVSGVAHADDDDASAPAVGAVTYERGESLPLGLRAERSETALVTVNGGYDGGRKSGVLDFAAELHLWGPITLRGGGVYTSNGNTLKPSVGALVQLFTDAGSGLAGSAGVFYKPEGLTEPEGEIEASFALGLRRERTTLVANLTYGQDGEGTERDGEVRLGGVYRVASRFYVGADSRFRFSLGSAKVGEPDYDLVAGPLATLVVWDLAVTAQVGVAAVKVANAEVGPSALLGVARVF